MKLKQCEKCRQKTGRALYIKMDRNMKVAGYYCLVCKNVEITNSLLKQDYAVKINRKWAIS